MVMGEVKGESTAGDAKEEWEERRVVDDHIVRRVEAAAYRQRPRLFEVQVTVQEVARSGQWRGIRCVAHGVCDELGPLGELQLEKYENFGAGHTCTKYTLWPKPPY